MSHTFTVTISDEEYRAYSIRTVDPDEHVERMVREQILISAIEMARRHAENPSQYLTPTDIAAIKGIMESEGDFMKDPKDWSLLTLREIAKRTSMPSRAEAEEPTP